MKKKRILVLTDDMPWGHRSIAKAIFSFLKENEKKNNYQVEYLEVKADSSVMDDIYKFYYKYSPKLGKIAYDSMNNRLASKIMDDVVKRNLIGLKKVVGKFDPDLIISAYFLHSHSLNLWRNEDGEKFRLWTVVADPWTISPITIVHGADLHLVYDEVGMNLAVKMGIPKEKVLVTGWWVRSEMYGNFNVVKIRENLGIEDNRPVIFIGGGSLGTSALPKLLPVLFFLKKKSAFIINTGTDRLAYKLVKNFIRVLNRVRKDGVVWVKCLGWIDNMAEVLSACDIVFGKAGPNFLFDCLACQKPFVAITHIGGQEDGNIDLIRKKKLGWVKERTDEMNKFLLEYLDKPKYFGDKYKYNILRELESNKKSLFLILTRIKEDLF